MSPSFLETPLGRAIRSPQSLFQAEQSQLAQPVIIGRVFHSLDHFCGPTLDTFQQLHVSPVQKTLHLDAVFLVRSHECLAEGQDHPPQSADRTPDTAQDMVGSLGCKDKLLTILHCQKA